MSDVVVVESPAKAKTINRYLGGGYTVLASMGHVRDLPPKDGSVRPEQDFAMDWQSDARGDKHVGAIAKALRGGSTLYLATDPDREGEAISWHVKAMLAEKKALKGVTVRRITFNEVTRSAVRAAMAAPRDLDQPLIEAYLARRALDYLVGFTLSPVLWRKLPGSRSAGRVQSVALRLICDREAEIEAFRAREYWTVEADFTTPAGAPFTARLTWSRRQEARAVRPARTSRTRCAPSSGRVRQVPCRLGREEARQAQPVCAVHHLDAAAGGVAQAWLRRAADHAPGAAALRRRRHRRRDHRPDHLHADRRRADGARGDRRDPRPCRGELRRQLPAIGARASTRARSRTPRRRTRRSVRPTSRALPTVSRPTCRPISAGSTN